MCHLQKTSHNVITVGPEVFQFAFEQWNEKERHRGQGQEKITIRVAPVL